MPNYITCWLQDPGDLPVGDGPPGGNGTGDGNGGGPPGGECEDWQLYYTCVPPTDSLDYGTEDDCNCNFENTIDIGDITNCTTDPPDKVTIDGVDYYKEACDPECESVCLGPENDCSGWKCIGTEGSCDEFPDFTTDYFLYQNGLCNKNNIPGCWGDDMDNPCDIAINPPPPDLYYEENDECLAADAIGDQDCQQGVPGACSGYYCNAPGCDEDGTCGYGTVPNDGGCAALYDSGGECVSTGWQSCVDDAQVTWWKAQNDCETSEECKLTSQCKKFVCQGGSNCNADSPNFDAELCCKEEDVSGECDCISDCLDCTYGGNDGFLTRDECLESPGCVACDDLFLCKIDTGTGVFGECERDEDCPSLYDASVSACVLDPDAVGSCYEDQAECIESGCECPGFVACGLGLDSQIAGCATCGSLLADVTGVPTGSYGFYCIYDDVTPVLGGKTCQQLYNTLNDGPYYWEFNRNKAGDEAAKQKLCTDQCKLGEDVCYACNTEDDCWECPESEKKLVGPKPCVKSDIKRYACGVEDDCELEQDGNGIWKCTPKSSGGVSECYLNDPECGEDCENCPGDTHNTKAICEMDCGDSGGDGLTTTTMTGFGMYGGPEAFSRIYAPNTIDNVFERNYSNRNFQNKQSYLGVPRGTRLPGYFKDEVHVGLRAVYDINRRVIPYSDIPYSDLADRNIERSLPDDFILKLNTAKDATGRTLKRKVFNTIRNLLISDRLELFNIAEVTVMLNRLISIQKEDKYQSTRNYTLPPSYNSILNESKALEMATTYNWPLQSKGYLERVSQRMKYWKTLAPDLEKNLPIRTADGTVTPFYYSITDTIVLAGSGVLTMSPGDVQRVTLSDGSIGEIPVQSLIDKAAVINLEHLQKIVYLLGDVYDFTMTVETAPSLRVDEKYEVTEARERSYMLTLDKSNIEDLDRDNPFIARTKSRYTYQSNLDTQREKASQTPWPCFEFYVAADDPIFDYITSGGTIDVISKDFVFDLFDDPNLPVLPRRGPAPIIILYPTDVLSKVPEQAISTYQSYGTREIKFTINTNPDLSDNWHPVFLKETLAFPGKGLYKSKEDLQGIEYTLNSNAIEDNRLYTHGSPVLPRPKFGVRQAYSLMKDIKDNYVLPANNSLHWFEIYERIDISKMRYMHHECANFNKFKSLLYMGKPSSDDAVNALYPKMKDLKSDRKTLQDTNITSFITYVKVKEGGIPVIPPNPL